MKEISTPDDSVPVVVAENPLEDKSSEHSVEEARCKEEETMYGACDGGYDGQQPVVQMQFMCPQRNDDRPHPTLDPLLGASAELAENETGGTSEVEEISQCQTSWQKAEQDERLSLHRLCNRAEQSRDARGSPRGRNRVDCQNRRPV